MAWVIGEKICEARDSVVWMCSLHDGKAVLADELIDVDGDIKDTTVADTDYLASATVRAKGEDVQVGLIISPYGASEQLCESFPAIDDTDGSMFEYFLFPFVFKGQDGFTKVRFNLERGEYVFSFRGRKHIKQLLDYFDELAREWGASHYEEERAYRFEFIDEDGKIIPKELWS